MVFFVRSETFHLTLVDAFIKLVLVFDKWGYVQSFLQEFIYPCTFFLYFYSIFKLYYWSSKVKICKRSEYTKNLAIFSKTETISSSMKVKFDIFYDNICDSFSNIFVLEQTKIHSFRKTPLKKKWVWRSLYRPSSKTKNFQ